MGFKAINSGLSLKSALHGAGIGDSERVARILDNEEEAIKELTKYIGE